MANLISDIYEETDKHWGWVKWCSILPWAVLEQIEPIESLTLTMCLILLLMSAPAFGLTWRSWVFRQIIQGFDFEACPVTDTRCHHRYPLHAPWKDEKWWKETWVQIINRKQLLLLLSKRRRRVVSESGPPHRFSSGSFYSHINAILWLWRSLFNQASVIKPHPSLAALQTHMSTWRIYSC